MANLVNNVDPFGDSSGVALYQFEGNANDTGGNYNGTWHGTEQYDTGKWGQGAKFNGSSYITINNIINGSNNPFSYSFWFKMDGGARRDIFAYGTLTETGDSCKVYANKNSSNTIYVNFFDTGDNLVDYPVTTTVLNYICITSDGTHRHVYLNNNLIHSNTGTFSFSDDKIIIFNNNYTETGLIDQVRIFNRTLTEQEVSALYNEEWYKFQNFDKVNTKEINYNNSNLISVYDDYSKTGRAIQRKIEIENKNVEVVTPFNSDLYKYTT